MEKTKTETELVNPVQDLINGNMPGLPQIIQNAMPVELPRANFNQDSISLFFGNIKRRQLVTSAKAEADLARYSRQQVEDKLGSIKALVTFSFEITDKIGEFEHHKDMRRIEVQKGHAELRNLELDAKEKEARIQQINYQTAMIAQEVKLSELELNIKMKQFKKLEEEDGPA